MGIKTIFMGTPDFSVYSAQALYDNGFDIIAVITQPDKEAGRGKKLKPSPAKVWATEKNIPVYQPEKAKTPEFVQLIKELSPQLIVTAAYGQILPCDILDLPEYGCVNVHGSILPKYRGASPIQQALFDGEKITGITLQYMAEKMDEGDIILIKTLDILPEDNAGTLFDRLALLGAHAIADYAQLLKSGKPQGIPQNHDTATYCKKIAKEQGNIDWSMSPDDIVNIIRAMTPSPGAYSFLNVKRVKLVKAEPVMQEHDLPVGTIVAEKNTMIVACKGGYINIMQIQPEGKSVLNIKDFLNGNKLTSNMMFERNTD